MGFSSHSRLQMLKIPGDDGLPRLQTLARESSGDLEVKAPRAPFGAGEVRLGRMTSDLKAETHAGQEPIELIVTEGSSARQELADRGLTDAADTSQFGLTCVGLLHYGAQNVRLVRHGQTIAVITIDSLR